MSATGRVPRVPLVLHPSAEELADGGASGFVLVLPGGGYAGRSEHEGPGVTAFLAERGIASGHLEYPVAPAIHPDALDQVLLALADLRAGVHGAFSGPVAVVGFSAGGHLAGSVATVTEAERADLAARDGADVHTLGRPDLVTLSYAVISLVNRAHVDSRRNLLGETDTEARAASLSVERRVDSNTPPAFLWHTADDAAVPVENSLLMAAALRDAAVPFELHVYPTGRHGVGLGDEVGAPVTDWRDAWINWLARGGVHPPRA
ncbi:alpha/beta hydrolase [Occultella glacieicola]|uniref:Alpha/beta hydrolase n=1 Tax=Occultella glacieicola TaxID=2518684 RepID=A0ABY2E0F7_9MICO|nr:alpha/beta hydrolase [Occultella glacieicola]TDE90889.1 alpha/beta hydrolase [Occultella glacieicola]